MEFSVCSGAVLAISYCWPRQGVPLLSDGAITAEWVVPFVLMLGPFAIYARWRLRRAGHCIPRLGANLSSVARLSLLFFYELLELSCLSSRSSALPFFRWLYLQRSFSDEFFASVSLCSIGSLLSPSILSASASLTSWYSRFKLCVTLVFISVYKFLELLKCIIALS